jgi:hypothetical protein
MPRLFDIGNTNSLKKKYRYLVFATHGFLYEYSARLVGTDEDMVFLPVVNQER